MANAQQLIHLIWSKLGATNPADTLDQYQRVRVVITGRIAGLIVLLNLLFLTGSPHVYITVLLITHLVLLVGCIGLIQWGASLWGRWLFIIGLPLMVIVSGGLMHTDWEMLEMQLMWHLLGLTVIPVQVFTVKESGHRWGGICYLAACAYAVPLSVPLLQIMMFNISAVPHELITLITDVAVPILSLLVLILPMLLVQSYDYQLLQKMIASEKERAALLEKTAVAFEENFHNLEKQQQALQEASDLLRQQKEESEEKAQKLELIQLKQQIILEQLRQNQLQTERQRFVESGMLKLSQALQRELSESIEDWTARVLTVLIQHCNATTGVLYLAGIDTEELVLTARYAGKPNTELGHVIKFGEGLIGQAAVNQKVLIMKDLSGYQFEYTFANLQLPLKGIAILPLVFNNRVEGVIEIGTLLPLVQEVQDFLMNAPAPIAAAVNALKGQDRIRQLLAAAGTDTAQ